MLLGAIAGISSTAGGPDPGPIPAIGVAEFIVGVVTIGTLIAGLAWRARRHLLRRVLWIACLLACTGLGVMYAWAQHIREPRERHGAPDQTPDERLIPASTNPR